MSILLLNHGEEFKAKVESSIYHFMYQQLKIDTYGSHASQKQYKLRHHVNMQFNKIPTTSYVMQQDMGK